MWKFILTEPNETKSKSEATDICDNNIQNKKRNVTNKSPKRTLQRKRHKIAVDYRDKVFDELRLIIVDPLSKLDGEESNILSIYFGISSENHSNEVISKMVLIHILNSWEGINTQSHPSSSAMSPS